MSKCECCGKPATRTCGYDMQPMLNFCDKCFKRHMREAHGVTSPPKRRRK